MIGGCRQINNRMFPARQMDDMGGDLFSYSTLRIACVDAEPGWPICTIHSFQAWMPVSVMLAYEAYFDALKPLNTSTDAWKSIVAGLVVLRLVDDWLDEGVSAIAKNPANVQAVREAIARVPEKDPVRSMLCNIIDIVTQSEQAAVQTIAASMFDYGRILHNVNYWTLARDVLISLLRRAGIAQDNEITAQAARHLGRILKHLGQLDASDRMYSIAVQASSVINQHGFSLTARMGAVPNLISRGRFIEASIALDAITTDVESLGLMDYMGDVLQDRAWIMCMRKNYHAALPIYKTSLMYPSIPPATDRRLLSLGGTLVGCGYHDAAKKILIPLQEQVQEETVRSQAMINLLEIAAKERDRQAFVRYRAELDGNLPLPELQVHYHLYLGKGYQNFWRPMAAMEERQTALAIATEYGLHQLRALVLDDIHDTDKPPERDNNSSPINTKIRGASQDKVSGEAPDAKP
jgi:tetratricopeptide (TPR) repeat protein